MRARLDLLICFAMAGAAVASCTRENPAFDDDLAETGGGSETTVGEPTDLPSESSDESPAMCELAGGMDMDIKVPKPCSETDDVLGLYERWFHVVEAAGSTWVAQFCDLDCQECEPIPGEIVVAPLSVAELAGPGTCMLIKGRRLGTGDDCNYHSISIQDMSNGGAMLVLARRTELLELPPIDTNTGLLGWEPTLVLDEACDCGVTPDACCDGQAPTRYAYQVSDLEPIPVGGVATVYLGQRSYDFWAFNAFHSGDCDAAIDVSWALVANQ